MANTSSPSTSTLPTRTVEIPDLTSPDRLAYRTPPQPQHARVFSLARALSTSSLNANSPAHGHTASPANLGCQEPTTPRMPLFPLPPPIVAAASPSFSFGEQADGDDAELRQHSLGRSHSRCQENKIVGLKRMRSFGSSRPSLLGPSRASPGLSGGYRPPPIRTAASLDPGSSFGGNGSFSDNGVSPMIMAPAPAAAAAGSSDPSATASNHHPPTIRAGPSPAESAFYSSASLPPATPRGGGGGRATPLSGSGRGRRVFRRLGRHSPVPAMSLVGERLYVGDETAAADLPALCAAGVTHILNCTHMPSALQGDARGGGGGDVDGGGSPLNDVEAVAVAQLQFCQLGLLDSIADMPRMQGAMHAGVAFIHEAISNGGTVLVHCHKGISRSATLAIAYLVATTHTTAEAVFEQMRTRRACIDPNLTYWTQLIEWERKHLSPSVLARQGSSSTPKRSSPAAATARAPSPVMRPLSRVG